MLVEDLNLEKRRGERVKVRGTEKREREGRRREREQKEPEGAR